MHFSRNIKILLTLCVFSNILLAQENDPWKHAYWIFNPYDSIQRKINIIDTFFQNKQNTVFPLLKTSANPPTPTAVDNLDIQVFPSVDPQTEPHISISKYDPSLGDPDETRRMIIGANTYPDALGVYQGYVYKDGTVDILYGTDDYYPSAGADPSTAFDAGGYGYVIDINSAYQSFSLIGFNITNFPPHILMCGIGEFNYPQVDKEMMAIDDMLNSPYKNSIYIAYLNLNEDKIKFIRSSGGCNFFQAIPLSSGFGHGPNVQTGPDGEVYVCWANYSSGTWPADGMGFRRSLNNGGVSFDPEQIIFHYSGIAQFGNQPDPLYCNTRVNDFPSMAVDKSCGFYNGRIYIAYPEKVSGIGNAIRVRYSDDQGSNWSSPITVSIPARSWFPWIAVDDMTGDVCVAYYAFDTQNPCETNTYVAYSSDGGNTFLNQKVSDVSHITAPLGPLPGYAGDYIGIAAHGGIAYPVWMDNRGSGIWQLYISPLILTKLTTSTSASSDINIIGPVVVQQGENLTYKAVNNITVPVISTYQINSGATVTMRAGNEIVLGDGFVSEGEFYAYIEPYDNCILPTRLSNQSIHQDSLIADNIKIFGNENIKFTYYPNPFTGHLHIDFLLEKNSPVLVSVYNSMGQLTEILAKGNFQAGEHTLLFNNPSVKPGVYFIKMDFGDTHYTKAVFKTRE